MDFQLYLYLLCKLFRMSNQTPWWRKELFFQATLIVVVFLFYSFDRDDPLIELTKFAFFSSYVVASMLINYALLDRFLYRKKYLWFFIWMTVILISVIAVEELVWEKLFYPDTRGKNFSNVIYTMLDVLPPIMILSGFKLAWDAISRQKELDEVKLRAKESELQHLKSQINPHFLFNNMNNLYALAIEESPKTPTVILALSDFLRYTLYDCNAEYVSINKEIEHLRNFIDLNQLQMEGRGKVRFEHNLLGAGYRIAPLLLLVFIENAFKHSTSSQTRDIEIYIDLEVKEDGRLHFVCKNSFQAESNIVSLSKGIGLANVRKRLNLLYSGDHDLSISRNDNEFKVDLKIKLTRR